MVFSTGYSKPNMTNLPPDLGKAIFTQLLSTPKPDEEQIHKAASDAEAEIVRIRKMENALIDA